MTSNEIKNMIDYTVNSNGTCEITAKSLNLALNSLLQFAANAVGKEEDLEIPSYWADKILSELQNYIEENNSIIASLQSELNSLKKDADDVNKNDIALFYNGTTNYVIINLTKNKVLETGGSKGIIYNPDTKTLMWESYCDSCIITFNDFHKFYYGTNIYTKSATEINPSRHITDAYISFSGSPMLFLETTTSNEKYELNLKNIS